MAVKEEHLDDEWRWPTASPGEKLDRAADTCPVCLASHALAVELGMGASPIGGARPSPPVQ